MSAGKRNAGCQAAGPPAASRLYAFILFFVVAPALANELSVDRKTIQVDDVITITVSLDGSFANVDALNVPLQNLVIDGRPSVSSEYQWINGQSSRRKVLRYSAHPNVPGSAVVGPLTIHGADGQVETLAAITLQVLPDATSGSNDPVQIMRELIATDRDPMFIVAQADKTDVFEGEEVVVTWTLYNAATVQQYSLGDIPKLENFWTEELDIRAEQPQQVALGGVTAQKLTIRRAALFPLRSGTLSVGSMAINASLMKRVSRGDPFGLFEGVMVDVHRRSAPIKVVARPIPPGPPVIGVGTMNLTCRQPVQANGGPIAFDVSLSGRANLRAVRPPDWQSPVDGTAQIIDRGVRVFPVNYDAWMTRQWRYLIFPAQAGRFVIPPLFATLLMPTGERREIRCEARSLQVTTANKPPPRPSAAIPQLRERPNIASAVIAVVVAIVAALAFPRMRRRMRLRRDVQALLRESPAGTRAAVEAAVIARGLDPAALLREASDRGDAYRAFRSLIDAAERDRFETTQREIGHRVRDVLVALT